LFVLGDIEEFERLHFLESSQKGEKVPVPRLLAGPHRITAAFYPRVQFYFLSDFAG
jgi:hypothetical protein